MFSIKKPHKMVNAVFIYWIWAQCSTERKRRRKTTTTRVAATNDAEENAIATMTARKDKTKQRSYKIIYGCPQAISSIFARICRLINWFQCVQQYTQFSTYFFYNLWLELGWQCFYSVSTKWAREKMRSSDRSIQSVCKRGESSSENYCRTKIHAIFGFDLDAFMQPIFDDFFLSSFLLLLERWTFFCYSAIFDGNYVQRQKKNTKKIHCRIQIAYALACNNNIQLQFMININEVSKEVVRLNLSSSWYCFSGISVTRKKTNPRKI